ncbi:MAG: hypothetical protein IIC92_10895, partial [Chloroflexi bacterium]|nr:hypothetical protein [Chloroflexota bacterium]
LTPPAELSATVHRHTEGNPLFVTEVIRDLVQSGELTEEKVAGRSTWSVRIPEGVREVIGRRLDRLSDRANEIFTTASVIGRDFTLDALRVLAEDTTEGQLLDVVDEGLDAKIIEELPDALGHYQFTHALVQETLSDELSTTRRVRLHARIAETLEELYGDGADDHAEELIPHFDEAEAVLGTERLVHYSVLAGEAALETFAPQAARIHFERAAARISDEDRDITAARTFSGLGLASLRGGLAGTSSEYQESWDIFARGFDIYVELGENSSAVSLASNVVFAGPRVSGSAIVLEKALELATPGSVDAGRLMARLAVIHWLEFGDVQRQAEYERLALEIGRATGDPSIEMLTLASRGTAAYFRHEYGDALVALLRVIELARSRSDTQAEVIAYLMACGSHLALGEGHKAEEQIQALGDLVERTGSARRPHHSMTALYAVVCGDWTETRRAARRDGAGPYNSILALVADAQTELEIDASPVEKLSVDGQRYPDYPGLSLLGACFVDSVRLDSSEQEQLIRLIADTRSNMDQGTMRHERYLSLNTRLAAATSCLAELNMPEGLADWAYNELEPLSKTMFIWMSVDRMLGRLAKAMERRVDAVSHFEDGLVFCRNAGYRPELAWTCSDYAEMLLDGVDGASPSAEGSARDGDHEKAIELQDEALTITRDLGMRPLTERILARREILRA